MIKIGKTDDINLSDLRIDLPDQDRGILKVFQFWKNENLRAEGRKNFQILDLYFLMKNFTYSTRSTCLLFTD